MHPPPGRGNGRCSGCSHSRRLPFDCIVPPRTEMTRPGDGLAKRRSETVKRPESGVARLKAAPNPRKSRALSCHPTLPQETRTAWWARQDSNLRPDRYERPALTAELQAHARRGAKARGGGWQERPGGRGRRAGRLRCRGSCAACGCGSGASACAAPWPRSGGCARG